MVSGVPDLQDLARPEPDDDLGGEIAFDEIAEFVRRLFEDMGGGDQHCAALHAEGGSLPGEPLRFVRGCPADADRHHAGSKQARGRRGSSVDVRQLFFHCRKLTLRRLQLAVQPFNLLRRGRRIVRGARKRRRQAGDEDLLEDTR